MSARPGGSNRSRGGLAIWLLTRALPREDRDAIIGDLEEALEGEDHAHPRLWYWGQALLFAASFASDRFMRTLTRRSARTHRYAEDLSSIREGIMLEGWIREGQLAVRSLGKRPGLVVTVVGTLALGIGANTAIFSVIYDSMLRPLPYSDPGELVSLSDSYNGGGGGSDMNMANFLDLRERVTQLEGMAAYVYQSVNVSGGDQPVRVLGLTIAPEFFSTLGIRPVLGRDFAARDNHQDSDRVVILSDQIYRERFGADPGVLGQTVILDATPHTVVGVLPDAMEFRANPRVFVPIRWDGVEPSRGGRNISGIARISDGSSLESARAELAREFQALAEAYPEQNENWTTWAAPLSETLAGQNLRRTLLLLGWSVGVLLLIACVNVANLLLVRAETRQREFAVRMALGAGRARLIPHFLSESLLLSALGGALGLLVAYWGIRGLTLLYGSSLVRVSGEVSLDIRALAFALALAAVTGIVVGLIPAMRLDSLSLQKELKQGSRGSSVSGSKLRQSFVIAQIGLAMVLLVTAGLLINSFWRVTQVDVGLSGPEQVLVARLSLPNGKYESREEISQFYEALMDRVNTLPGVTSAGLTTRLPLNGGTNFTNVPVVGDPERVSHFVEWRIATPDYFSAIGVRQTGGRLMDARDVADSLVPLVINEELARQLFPGEDPIGQRIDPFSNGTGQEIIGVVSDIRDLGPERPAPPTMYAAFGAVVANSSMIMLIRSSGDALGLAPLVRQVVADMDPDLPVHSVRLLSDVVSQRFGSRRFSMSMLMLFAGLALALGGIGIYGVMSYSVAQRTREVGLRLALGARSSSVLGLILKNGLRLTIWGIGLGLATSVAASRLVSNLLFGVEAYDVLTYSSVIVVLTVVSLLATYLPARRASSVDPLEALRHE